MSESLHVATLAVPPNRADHSKGALDARVIIVEYGDFECPSCRMAVPTPRLLLERFENQVCFIYRHFPVPDAHPHAMRAAEAAEAAGTQGKFWQMHDRLFECQDQLEEGDLLRYAGEIQLDLARYAQDMRDHVHLQTVTEQMEGGRRSHLRATPAFFVDGIVQDVSFGMQELHDAVAAAVRPLD